MPNVRVKFNRSQIEAKLGERVAQIEADIARAVEAAFADVVRSTPEDTGFLRASWFVRTGRQRLGHPNPPDYARKRAHDNQRNRKTPPADALPKPDPAFTGNYADVGSRLAPLNLTHATPSRRRSGTKSRLVTTATIIFVNDAPYAGAILTDRALDEQMRFDVRTTIRAFLAGSRGA